MSSRRYRLHLDRSTSSGNIGLLTRSDDNDLLSCHRKKFPVDSKVSTDAKPSNYHPPEVPGQVVKPSVVKSSKNPRDSDQKSEDSSLRSEQQQIPLRKAPAARKSIFFVGSPEKLLVADDVRAIGFGDLVKSCASCKKEFEPKKDVQMYHGRPFCSFKCRDARIASDGYTKKQYYPYPFI
ncbi:hypothetical protein CRG98_023574 [Punica granatum]|uniref:FLZ-type domain-containing protein n=1 Tax=Punica granatum TaxID=22663 RepID=A0A2I0JIE6_PUNGR|nr:hypothetical protein CRG98_023574 [Punica granatum]